MFKKIAVSISFALVGCVGIYLLVPRDSGNRLPASKRGEWATLESSKLCHFQGESFGQLTKREFLEFTPQKLDCDGGQGETVWVDKFILPFWVPIIPLDLMKKSLTDLAFLFQINANIGRYYVHLYKDGGDVPAASGAQVALPDELPMELESLHRQLRRKEEERDNLTLNDKRNSLLGQVKRWREAARFPYVWENATKMGRDELWSVEGERTFLFGPMLTAGFILAESASMWANFGGNILSLDFLMRSNYRVTVRKMKRSGQDNIQVMFQNVSHRGFGGGVMSKSLASDITFGSLVRDSSINLLAGAAMQMNRLDLMPASVEGFLKNSSHSDFIVEFDAGNPESRRLYNKVMSGDFREIDFAREEFRGNAARLVVNESKKRSSLYTRQKVGLPFVFSGTNTCRKDQYTERLMTTLELEMFGIASLNLVSDICHRESKGLLKSAFFGASSTTGGFGAGRVSSQGEMNYGLVGTHSFSSEKVSHSKLKKYSRYFYDLGVKRIHHDFQTMLQAAKASGGPGRIDVNFSFFLGRGLVTKLFLADREFVRDAIERAFDVKMPATAGTYAHTTGGRRRRSGAEIAAKRLFDSLGGLELLHLQFMGEKEFMEAAKELISLFSDNEYTLQYAAAVFSILNTDINAAVEEAHNERFSYYLSLNPPSSGVHRYSENSLAIIESDFNSIKTLLKNRFGELWGTPRGKEAYWFPVSSLTGKEGAIPSKVLDEIGSLERSEDVVAYECDCLFANEDKKKSSSATITGIAFKGTESGKLSPDTYGRAVNQCLRASSEAVYQGSGGADDVHFVHVPLNSCKVRDISMDSKQLVSKMLRNYKSLNSQIEEILSRETMCDKAMIFKKVPNGLRKALSALLGGYGWRIRGGGFEEELEGFVPLDGNLSTISMSSLISFVSANSCEDFVTGVKSSIFLAAGGVPGWGECFDMGNDGVHWRGEHNEKYFHDFPCMTTRMNFTTSMMASYLESKGYDFNQDMAGPTVSLIYLLTKNYDPEVWNEVANRNTGFYNKLGITSKSPRVQLSEFLAGMIYGYTLSDALLKGKNGMYLDKKEAHENAEE